MKCFFVTLTSPKQQEDGQPHRFAEPFILLLMTAFFKVVHDVMHFRGHSAMRHELRGQPLEEFASGSAFGVKLRASKVQTC